MAIYLAIGFGHACARGGVRNECNSWSHGSETATQTLPRSWVQRPGAITSLTRFQVGAELRMTAVERAPKVIDESHCPRLVMLSKTARASLEKAKQSFATASSLVWRNCGADNTTSKPRLLRRTFPSGNRVLSFCSVYARVRQGESARRSSWDIERLLVGGRRAADRPQRAAGNLSAALRGSISTAPNSQYNNLRFEDVRLISYC